jgi:sirohydrochlorin cobaltochelatase
MPPALSNASSVPTGVLLVGHGTRSERGRKQFESLTDEIAAALDARRYAAELAYLELASPTIEDAVARLVGKGVQRLVVAPLLLFAAAHAKVDIPTAVREALLPFGKSDLPISQTEPLGLQEPVLELAARRFREAVDPRIGAAETCLLLIGRGSRDAEATAEMGRLGELLQERLGIGQTQVGFLAMAAPTAQEVISAAMASPFRQMVIQPHLLFHGELLERLVTQMSLASAKDPRKIWRMSRVLGDGEGASDLARMMLQAIELSGNK